MIAKLVLQWSAVIGLLGAVLFGAAGTVWFGGAILIAAFGMGGLVMSLWLVRRDPALLKERMGKGSREKPAFDRILLPLANAVLFVWIGWMALDIRWHGTAQMPLWCNLAGGAIILVSFALIVWVLRENTFATAVVRAQPERGQTVISSGPYRFVRHPMYSATVLTYGAIPFTLGSRLGLFGIALPVLILAVRIYFEEAVLRRALPGYEDYRAKVRYRLVPFVW